MGQAFQMPPHFASSATFWGMSPANYPDAGNGSFQCHVPGLAESRPKLMRIEPPSGTTSHNRTVKGLGLITAARLQITRAIRLVASVRAQVHV